ncbi:Ankyrin repeat and BTB/POZ domain-containing protein 1 [Merluccius polli]|uniref:Ankyrin repeat and BTB/POZ domain-containing protein 1 n=1 Tax=Merluccius polli TaxID=89951 RepID=A0AA47PC59_MERPO|nr:Ankyrin repeat and BTB/POZ domain-containing protein 1 [Merluccius polli]
MDLNVRDRWDSTPLYYACLCGYEELVQYLLDHGAKCEANTFDGERCMYGSLNDSIQRLLKDYKCITAKTMHPDYFDYFLHMILEQGQYSDVKFMVHGEIFLAHRCVLGARSEYFTMMFETKWKGKNLITLKHPLINPAAFGALLQYFYTGCMDINVSFIEDCILLAKQCKMEDLIDELQHKCKQVYEYVSNKPQICVKVLTLGPHNDQLEDNIIQLAVGALPAELRVGCGQLPFIRTDDYPTYPDIVFRVDGYNFLCHKVFFCGRSDYFKALLEDHFSEGEILTSQPNVPVLTLHNISYKVFISLLYYIYSDNTEIFPDNVLDLLYVADMYLLPGLKRMCGTTLAETICEDNVLQIWQTAKLFRLSRLEYQCKELMARNIERLVARAEFAEMIQEDARSVKNRQETDSIPLVDDIRYHITSNVQMFSAMEETHHKLQVLEQLLVSIGLEC